VEGVSTLAVRLRNNLEVKGKRETKFLPMNPHNAEPKVYILEKGTVLKVTQTTDEAQILWTDRSRLEDRRVGYAVVWTKGEEKWKGEWHYQGKKKEVFNTEVYAI
jgi:hypothetical protein